MSGKEQRIVIFWFRRDLRIEDNTGLFHALRSGFPVLPVFIFDTDILEKLQDRTDARVTFIHQTLGEINTVFEKEFGARLDVRHGRPIEIFRNLINEFPVQAVYANEDYEPYAIKRDTEVAEFLEHHHVEFHCSKDQVIFAREDVLKSDGSPYTVYTPYSKQWLKHYHEYRDPDQQISQETGSFVQGVGARMPTLEALGFQKSDIEFQGHRRRAYCFHRLPHGYHQCAIPHHGHAAGTVGDRAGTGA